MMVDGLDGGCGQQSRTRFAKKALHHRQGTQEPAAEKLHLDYTVTLPLVITHSLQRVILRCCSRKR